MNPHGNLEIWGKGRYRHLVTMRSKDRIAGENSWAERSLVIEFSL